ncbi:unnamed protein product, partial [Durusdinium trenchii]
ESEGELGSKKKKQTSSGKMDPSKAPGPGYVFVQGMGWVLPAANVPAAGAGEHGASDKGTAVVAVVVQEDGAAEGQALERTDEHNGALFGAFVATGLGIGAAVTVPSLDLQNSAADYDEELTPYILGGLAMSLFLWVGYILHKVGSQYRAQTGSEGQPTTRQTGVLFLFLTGVDTVALIGIGLSNGNVSPVWVWVTVAWALLSVSLVGVDADASRNKN